MTHVDSLGIIHDVQTRVTTSSETWISARCGVEWRFSRRRKKRWRTIPGGQAITCMMCLGAQP